MEMDDKLRAPREEDKEMKVKFGRNKDFKSELIKFFKQTRIQRWDKDRVVRQIENLWMEHLELIVNNIKKDALSHLNE